MINTLTSLRFLFAMMIFGTHCYLIDAFFNAHIFKEGFVGVSFFFTLSGFIIAYKYQRQMEEKKISRRTFWVARIARIYPLHWLTLLVAALAGNYVVASGGVDWLKHFLASLTLTNAYIPAADYFFSFNSPSWSLCCEQLFYFSFPFLIPLARNGKRLLCIFFIMAVLVVAGMYFTPEADIKGYWYVNPITRFPDFVLGMLLFRLYIHLRGMHFSFFQASAMEILSVFIFLAFYFYAAEIPKVYRYSCYYWLPVALLLLCFSLQRGVLSRVLSLRLFVKGGEISYSFYLIHLFVISAYVGWSGAAGIEIAWYVSVPVLFCLAVLLSSLSYRYFEKPMNRKIKSVLNKKEWNNQQRKVPASRS